MLLPIHCFGLVRGIPCSEFYRINCATGASRRSRMRAISASKRHGCKSLHVSSLLGLNKYPERLKECWRYDQQVPNPFQSYPTSGHYWGVGGDHHRGCCVRGPVISCTVFSRIQHQYSRPSAHQCDFRAPDGLSCVSRRAGILTAIEDLFCYYH